MRIVSWNIQKGIGIDFRRDIGRTADVLAATDADVIGLQEVLHTRAHDQAAALADRLGMELAWGRARDTRDGEYGNALLVRGDVLATTVHDVSVPGCESRSVLAARCRVGDVTVRVFVCHFGLGFRERAIQSEGLLDVLHAAEQGEPRVVMGDFNEWHGGPVRRAFRSAFPHAARARRSHPSPFPLFAIDRMAWDPALEGSLEVRSVRHASDHRMLLAVVESAGLDRETSLRMKERSSASSRSLWVEGRPWGAPL
jgi:endonuclease/exonuclease/phosphatase family metal-dependent hydrolase